MNLTQSAKRKAQRLFLILLSAFSFQLSAYTTEAAPLVSAQELLENPQKYDGKTVIFKGEVIGDIMLREEFAWINVRDESGALGIFCPRSLVEKIAHQGSYQSYGDIISVRGRFRQFCAQHGGETDIHAEKITLLEKGRAIAHSLEPKKVRASIVLGAIVFFLVLVYLIVRRFR